MSFSETTRYHQLIDGRILEAECLNEYGDWICSTIDLNNYIGNINGTLEWDSAGFFDTAVNVNLVEFGRRLEACLVRESGMEDICGLWLDERISNINGELVYRKQTPSSQGLGVPILTSWQ
ncbi:Cyanovirin-N [Morchella snyderi]|nr:Cyanovirin-N [Morchella snyderi]